MRIPRHVIRDRDIDWFGVDRDGRVGHFTTFGAGCLPAVVAADAEALDRLYDFFTDGMPARCEARLESAELTMDEAEPWMHFARRGLYGFDAGAPAAPVQTYRRVVRPSVELDVATLPDGIRALLARVEAPEVSFARAVTVGLMAFGPLAPSD